MEVVEATFKASVVSVVLEILMIHSKLLNNFSPILEWMMMTLDSFLEEEKQKKIQIIQKKVHLDLVDLEDLKMMISLEVA